MRVIRAIAILFTVVLGVALPARAQVLYGAGAAPNSDPSVVQPSYLYRIDPATTQVTQIGPIGFSDVRGMDVDANTGAIYATAFRRIDAFVGEFLLLTINPATGQGSELMSWSASANDPRSRVAVRPSDGAIFVGWGAREFGMVRDGFLEITRAADMLLLNADVFDFGPDDRLWVIYSEGHIRWINLETGESSSSDVAISLPLPR